MAKFLLLLHEDPNAVDWASASPEDMQAVIGEYMAWRQKMETAGAVLGGEKLTDEGGRILRNGSGGMDIADGPFTEAKEIIGGYFVVEAADYEAAAALCADSPALKYGTRIEVRQIHEM